MFSKALFFIVLAAVAPTVKLQISRRLSKFEEVFSWKQLTFNIDGVILNQDQDSPVIGSRGRFSDDDEGSNWNWSVDEPSGQSSSTAAPSTNQDDENRFFIQYNNVPMGMERVGKRLFVTIPRRRWGIPATLNYIDLDRDSNTRSPALRPYPNLRIGRTLTSVYRTRADSCGRLWMVDTGRMELPNVQRQLRTPAIVIFDLNTDTIIRRYELKPTDVPAENTPTGLASITVDITNGACDDAYAYIPDLTTFGLVVYSLRENDSWRHSHNYYSFTPSAGNLFISGERFQWSDGVFSMTLVPGFGGCKTAYFHSLIGTQEYSVSTCLLKNRTAINDRNYFAQYSIVGDRGEQTQSTMHDYHAPSSVVFYAEIGRDAVSCWNTGSVLRSTSVAVLARHTQRLSYPSDLHVTGDEVWVMANTLPRFGYSRLNTQEYNFYIYRGNVYDLISGTVCAGGSLSNRSGYNATEESHLL